MMLENSFKENNLKENRRFFLSGESREILDKDGSVIDIFPVHSLVSFCRRFTEHNEDAVSAGAQC